MKKVLTLLFLLFIVGCGYGDKEPSRLIKIDNKPNSFQMFVIQPFVLIHGRERVKAIQVYEPDESISEWDKVKVFWRVVAKEPVDAEGFEITVGEVPTEFIQVIPPLGETFRPVPDKKYHIAVKMAHPLAMPWVETEWIAESSTEN